MRQTKNRTRLLHILIPLILFILGCPSSSPPQQFMADQVATGLTILGEFFFLTPESRANLVVQVRDPSTNQAVQETNVRVLLGALDQDPQEIFSGQTDESGLIPISFTVPPEGETADPNQMLTIIADTPNGPIQQQAEVYVGRAYNVLITTDKPVYQPGQIIHLRGLALDTTALKAAQGQPLVLTVEDPSGNKLMRKELATSQYGIASADFALDSQAASGDYIITAEMGPTSSTRSVEVKPYTLPRFKVTFQGDKAFYLPGELATGTVDAQYFFGKPVVGGAVTIKGFATDVDRFQVFELSGVTDENGFYNYEFQVPDYFVGQLENNTANIDLEISVVDTANHVENIDESVTIAEKLILIEAVPESGFLRPGIENIIYLQTSYPDGRAAATTITATTDLSTTVVVQTDEFGLATMTLTPENNHDFLLALAAQDSAGQAAEQRLILGSSGDANAVLLRPDKAQYQIGETLNIDLYVAGNASTVYLDVIKGRQTFGLVALPVKDGVAQAAIDIDGSLLGTLELNAYVITNPGEIVRDRRLVLVNPAPAQIDLQTDAEVYRPGATATLDIAVSRDGTPMAGALGISIVDESVFSVGTQDPGFARTYFLLERELLEPRYEIHDFVDLADDDHSPYDDNPDSVRIGQSGARNVALFGFFGEELAAIEQQTVAVTPTSAPQPVAMDWTPRLALALPLVGFAFYDGTRKRRRALIALVLFSLGAFVWSACASAPSAAPAMDMAASEAMAETTTATQGTGQPPRLRQYFPETLYWMPEVETDADGHVQIDVPIADSITTWRISVLASDQDGNLGSAETGLRVFQDFFVEPDLPRFLTVGDELAVPVSIFNYLDEAQEISLEVAPADWFEFVEEADLTFTIGPNEVAAAYIPIRITNFGLNDFQITATGSQMSDAVLRQVEVLPDGMPAATLTSGKLEASQAITMAAPANAIPGTAQVTVKIYPGIVSQMIEGLEGMLQQPYGCFEQTSSATYPNVMVLDYLKNTGQINPRIQLQAEQYINLGYQRLVSFEVDSTPGGFSLFGDPPPQTMLTAYGLMEFTDMSQVSYVDPAILERTANYLFQRQNSDGSWSPEGMTHMVTMDNSDLLATAYIVWALSDAGYAQSEPVQNGMRYVMEQLAASKSAAQTNTGTQSQSASQASDSMLDPYTLALIANAAVASGNADAQQILDQLLTMAQPGPKDTVYWHSELESWMGSSGSVAGIETTAMVATALLRTDYKLDVAQQAIDYLVSQRDRYGMFYTTQATVLALKALLLAAEVGGEAGDATVTISLNGERTQTLTVNAENADVVQQIRFDDLGGDVNDLSITVEGERSLQYQVITESYIPWADVKPVAQADAAMRVDVQYDRTTLQVNDTVNVTAQVELLAAGTAGTVLVDLGIPPGFSPVTDDLDALVEAELIDRYELTGRQIILYLTDVPSGEVYTFNYGLLARFPIKAQTPSSTAYDYYTPDQRDTQAPQRIVVELGTPGQ